VCRVCRPGLEGRHSGPLDYLAINASKLNQVNAEMSNL